MKITTTTTLTIAQPGDPAKRYWLVPSTDSISRVYKADGSRVFVPAKLSCRLMKQVGGNESVEVSDCSLEGLSLRVSMVVETNGILSNSGANDYKPGTSLEIPAASINMLRCFVFDLYEGANCIESRRISVVDDGKPGTAGKRGPALRGPMDWMACPANFWFQSGAEGDEFVDVVIFDKNYYMCKKSHSKTTSNNPGSVSDQLEGLWQISSQYDLIISRIILAKYQLVENLGVSVIEMKDADGNILFEARNGNVTCKTGTFNNIDVQSGKIAGFKIQGHGLTCETEDDGSYADAFIYFNNRAKGSIAAIGTNILPGVAGGLRAIAQFQNHDTSGLPTDPNYGQIISVRGSRDNIALQFDGGAMCGVAMRNRYVSSSVTLGRFDYNVIGMGSADMTITLPVMGLYDDGHVIRFKRLSDGAMKLAINYCYTYNGTASRYTKPCVIYDDNQTLTPDSTLPFHSKCDALELVWCRDIERTIGGTTYYGAWIEYKLPMKW